MKIDTDRQQPLTVCLKEPKSSYSRAFLIEVGLIPDNNLKLTKRHQSGNANDFDRKLADKQWFATISFRCHDIGKTMKEGLYWTSKNSIPELERYETMTPFGHKSFSRHISREYTLHEFPDMPNRQASWVANVAVFSRDKETLSSSWLDNLVENNVHSVKVWNKEGQISYEYGSEGGSNETFHAIDGNLPPRNDHLWLLPKESPLNPEEGDPEIHCPWEAKSKDDLVSELPEFEEPV